MSQTPDELGQKIKEARDRQARSIPQDKAPRQDKSRSSAGKALRAASDLVAALLVGGFLGYWIDKALGTKPLFMIIMFFLGFAAGFLNIYRAQQQMDNELKEQQRLENDLKDQ